ncbi:MAG: hypothetical protein M3Y57_02785 [Acidobacteriota bacterium]|nr:hypothetical protein [Acidobacteriota bacterium]
MLNVPLSLGRMDSPGKSIKFVLPVLSALLLTVSSGWASSSVTQQVEQCESAGDLAGARSLLETEAANRTSTSGAEALAEFLDRHDDPGRRDAYLKWAAAETDGGKQRLALRQVVLIDFMQGKKADLASDLDRYKSAGGSDLVLPSEKSKPGAFSTVMIPGPLSSFARMAALSTDLDPQDLLPALARNIVTNGYEASGNESLQQTEYLRLLLRYVAQARELQGLAKANKIVIPNCDSEETGNLLKVLGYRMRGSCGADIVLETVNPTRAFLTADSAFPLTQLEQDLRGNHRFELPYAPTPVPVLYGPAYWLSAVGRDSKSDFLEAFTSDPTLCRLYLGLSHVDSAVADALRAQTVSAKLRLYASVLDFYGGMFQIRNGAAVVPGSPRAWASLVGANPSNPGAFFDKLLTVDDGWLASYYDALSRLEDGPTLAYLSQPERMKRFYDALRGKITSPGPARPVFRSSTDLMLLTTALRIDANGAPHIPGNMDIWRTLFIKHPHGKYDGKLTRAASSWRTSDDLLEALFALSRKTADNEPLHIFLAVNDVDRGRTKPVGAELAARLINGYRAYGAQYRIFADSPNLSEASITGYLDLCAGISSSRDSLTKADAAGTVQALVELWSILCRQNAIPLTDQDAVFDKLTKPFLRAKLESDVFNAGRSGVDTLLAAAEPQTTGSRQERLMQLLVGPVHSGDETAPLHPAESFIRVLDAQRLIPLDALIALADKLGKGGLDPKTAKVINDQLERIEDVETLHGSMSRDEKTTLAMGYWSDKHIDQERKFDLDSVMKNTEKKDGRNALAPFLRDTLVGFVYAYYAPAGAEILFTNPMFVRSHDFTGPESTPAFWRATEVAGSGWPASSGGKLTGSLISLPYALAQAEQNFLTPRREQALIWADLVPQIIMNVTVTRWRDVTPDQIHWVSLHVRRGWNLLADAALDTSAEPKIMDSTARFMTPAGVERLRDALRGGDFALATSQMPPSYLYALADDPRLKGIAPDVESIEIAALTARGEQELSPEAISRTFGTAKPTLTHSYRPGLLYLRTFPALMGYSSRILAETWESNNLYYAVLAEEAGIPANRLDAYVPQWNQAAIENIFATHLEDWPALIRSLNTTADGVLHRNTQRAGMAAPTN